MSSGDRSIKFVSFIFIVVSLFSGTLFAQEFYVNKNRVISKIFKPINSNWTDLNFNESISFLKGSGFDNIKYETTGDNLYVSGDYSFDNYVFIRTLIFKNKLIEGYIDNLSFFLDCSYCETQGLLERAEENPLLREYALESLDASKLKDSIIKELVLSKFHDLCKQENLYKMTGEISNGLYDIEKSNYSAHIGISRRCNVKIIDNKFAFNLSKVTAIKDGNYFVGEINLKNIDSYDLIKMINIFLMDCKINGIDIKQNTFDVKFEKLNSNIIGLSYAIYNDELIKIRVDPEAWEKASVPKRWYLLYHELGHDVLNLEHGHGGKMMYNFADRGYSWREFWNDKNYMLNNYTK